MKKIFKTLALILIVLMATSLTACGNSNACTTTMSISVNPSATFTLNKQDKIIAVTFDNEDAGRIFANVDFVGKDVNEAIDMFVEIGVITGHLNFTAENEFYINVNGKNAEEVKAFTEKVKTRVNQTCSNLGITASCNVASTEQALQNIINKVQNLAPEYSEDELKEMAQKDMSKLVELVKEVQTKYAGLAYNQINEILENISKDSLKQSMLQAIANARMALEKAEEYLNSPELREQYNKLKKEFDDAVTSFEAEINTIIKETRNQAEKVKQNLKELASQEITTFKNSETYSNLTDEQKSKIDALINEYFPA